MEEAVHNPVGDHGQHDLVNNPCLFEVFQQIYISIDTSNNSLAGSLILPSLYNSLFV